MKPLISIIIPTYNRAHLIAETIDSVLEQSYTNWECVVVDDGSTDNTEEVLKIYCAKDTRIIFYKRPVNRERGANTCRNYGYEISKGCYIKWLDSDDILKRNTLKEVIENTKSHNYDVLVHLLEFVDEKLSKKNKVNTIKSKKIVSDYFMGKISYYISGPTWKRSFLDKQEYLFDESISNLDDWDFNLRMLYQKPSIVFIELPLVLYRVHSGSLSKEIDKLNIIEIKSEMNARRKHINLIENNKLADMKILKNYIKKRYRYFLRQSLVTNSKHKFYFLYKLTLIQVELLDFIGVVKSWIGFIIYSIFKKGYRFIK